MPAIVITLCAKKGGVGKTSLSVNLAGYLSAEHKCRVLLIDADDQSSLSQLFMKPEKVAALPREQTLAAAFDVNCKYNPKLMIHKTDIPGLHFVPATEHMEEFNWPRKAATDKQFSIRQFVKDVRDHFTFIVIDTPPTLNTLPTWSGVLASHYVISPIVPELFSAQSIIGLDRLMADARKVNPAVHFLGYVVNKKVRRRKLHADFEQLLRRVQGDRVFKNVVTDLTGFAEAQAKRVPITSYDMAGQAAEITKNLAAEIVGRLQANLKERKANRMAKEAA